MTHGIFQRDIIRTSYVPISFPGYPYDYSDMSYTMRVRYWQQDTPQGLQAWAGVKILRVGTTNPPPRTTLGNPIVNDASHPYLWIRVSANLFGSILTASAVKNGGALTQGVELACWTWGVAFGADVQWKARHGSSIVQPMYNIGPFQTAPNNIGYMGTPARSGW